MAGTEWGLASPVSGSSPLVLASLALAAGSPVEADASHRERAVICIEGEVAVDGHRLPPGELAVLRPGTTPTLTGPGTAAVLGGDPVGRRHLWWNFVHADPDRIERAKADWRDQRFPLVPDDHDPFVPLPSS